MVRQTRWRAVMLSAALIGAVFTAPTHAEESKIDEHFLLLMGARNAAKAGKHETAIARYRRLLEHRPSYPDAGQEFGWALVAAGRIQEAEEQFRIILQTNPKDIEAWKGLLEAARKGGKQHEILKSLERLVELEPARRDLRMQLALELHNRGRFAEAEAHIVILLGE
ncbi:MAG: hypothetical protein C3F12_05540 [Candidatus Methylomirabilota bacterium]|nr:tetratricopeptide repeat protein [Candidatus Methylomirabilis sp.]NJD67908.1 tetratricopeptide repeat protein [candidate division NC10 bacterium]PWB47432.1 MAG: hypothetical protein C3F12_05540 [candidate division NC10 bacterium]